MRSDSKYVALAKVQQTLNVLRKAGNTGDIPLQLRALQEVLRHDPRGSAHSLPFLPPPPSPDL